jgi:hypothetical protein
VQKSVNVELWVVQKRVHCADLEKCCKMSIYLQNSASIQLRTSHKKVKNSSRKTTDGGACKCAALDKSSTTQSLMRTDLEAAQDFRGKAKNRGRSVGIPVCIEANSNDATLTVKLSAFSKSKTYSSPRKKGRKQSAASKSISTRRLNRSIEEDHRVF